VDNIKECISNLEDLELLQDSISSFLSGERRRPTYHAGSMRDD
jgi:hypothetical protein